MTRSVAVVPDPHKNICSVGINGQIPSVPEQTENLVEMSCDLCVKLIVALT